MKIKQIVAYCIVTFSFFSLPSEMPLTIITASYNNSLWVHNYLLSIAEQTYKDWHIIYTDDCSTDDTVLQLIEYAQDLGILHKITIIRNARRQGHLANQYSSIHSCDPNTICVIIDGDDWLAHEHALSRIAAIYGQTETWLTYGQFLYWKKNKKGFCRPIPPDIVARNAIREISWRTSHLRTFYAGLFQQIDIQDLMYQGAFFPKCVDVVTMFAMIEMAATHITFIPDILYIYNDDNPISYHHDPSHQRMLEEYIRTMPRYKPLKEKIW